MSKRKGFQGSIGLILLGLLFVLSTTATASAATSGIRINEVLFNPGAGGHQWVELKNSGAAAVNIAGYRITNEAGAWYTIPTALPAVPSGAFVVVVFDGAGSGGDDYDFSDNVATLHTTSGLADILGTTSGQVALYVAGGVAQLYLPAILNTYNSFNPPVPSPPTAFPEPAIVSFVAWGAAPGDRAANASKAGIWSPRWFKSLTRGLGAGFPSTTPNETIGLLPGSLTGYPDDWAFYLAGEVTKGSENPVPGISFYYPRSGATIDGETFSIIWAPVQKATGYQFQMDNNSNFSSPEVNLTLTAAAYTPTTPVASGTYYWRVRVLFAGGRQSLWSNGFQVISEILPTSLTDGPLGIPNTKTYVTPRIAWQLQHKDTNMLCLDGCPLTATATEGAWDAPHTVRGTHGNMYCVRGSISMMASYYGGKLSQDRITYELFKGDPPEGDLGHNIGCSLDQITNGLTWALGLPVPVQNGKPTFAQIKTWIDQNRPIGSVIPGHMRLMDGYFEVGTHQKIHLLDPWDREKWVNYADDNIIFYWVGPAGAAGAPNIKSDDPDLKKDTDGDGLNDFDEKNRFHTDPNIADTDNDRVPDKLDIVGYVFLRTGVYDWIDPDRDGDGKRKELDPDNDTFDNSGLNDGCEDINLNGLIDPDETSNFNPVDDKNLLITLTWPALGTDVDLHLDNPSGGVCYYSNKNPDWGVAGITCDDPSLDLDCITTCAVEHITLNKLENGAYIVKVHYYSDHGQGPTSPSVTVWLQGASYSFGPQTLSDGDVWDVCTINWPAKTIGSAGGVTSLSNTERLRMPRK